MDGHRTRDGYRVCLGQPSDSGRNRYPNKRDTQLQKRHVRALGLGLSFAMQLQNSFVNKEELCMPIVELRK